MQRPTEQTGLSDSVRDVAERAVLHGRETMIATSTESSSSERAAFALLTSMLVTLLASSSAPTPLYATYQARWGFSPVTITVIFGVYAIAVLGSLGPSLAAQVAR